MNQADFARHIGATPGYITQLKTAGRLVMQGRMVDAEASVKLIADTHDPGKAGVAERHEKEREQKQTGQALDITMEGSIYQHYRAMNEKSKNQLLDMEVKQKQGILLVADEVRMAVADGDAIIRNRLESLPDMLAPQLAEISDEQKIRALLMDQIEYLLGELSRSFHTMTKS